MKKVHLYVITSIALYLVGCGTNLNDASTEDYTTTTIGTCNIVIGDTVTTSLDTTTYSKDTSSTNVTTQVTTIAEGSKVVDATTTETKIFGYTVSQVDSVANEMFNTACQKYRDILVNCIYGVDFNDGVVDEEGRSYYLVTDPYHNTMDSVLEDWHTVFTNNFDDLIYQTYTEYNGYLYGYTGILQVNSNYSSTTLQYYSTNKDEVIYKATCHYSSGDKVFKFAMRYYPKTKEWRVTTFTMPY